MNTSIRFGFIALFGIAVDDGMVVATCLEQIFRRRKLTNVQDLRDATVEAGTTTHSSLSDDSVHHIRRAIAGNVGDWTGRRRRSSHGVARIFRYADRTGIIVRRAGTVLRVHAIQNGPWHRR